MKIRDKIYTVDLNTKVYSVPVYKQFDNLIPFSIKLIEDGKETDLTGYTALAFFQNDKNLIQKNCVINGNIIKAILDNNILALPGLIKVEFQFRKNQEIITTFQMRIQVEESLDKENAVESTPQWDLLGQAITDIASSIDDINLTKDNLINDINTNISTLNSRIDSSIDLMTQDINTTKTNLINDITELSTKVDERVALEIFDGDYNSLINKPDKISEFENDVGYITSADMDTSQNHIHINKDILDKITQDKINSWDNKSEFNGDYNSLINKPSKISEFENDAKYITINDVDTSQNHTHENKKIIDEITQEKVDNWNSKSEFDGDYNNLANKPDLTSKAITGLMFWIGTQAEYDVITEKNNTTLYIIKEEIQL